MRIVHLFWLSLCACIVGAVFFAYQQELIIIQQPDWQTASTLSKPLIAYDLWLTHGNGWKHEHEQCMQPDTTHDFLYHLVQRWLHYAHREGAIEKKIHVQSIMFAYDTTALLISCDRNPFNPEFSTYANVQLIKGLLKTVAQEPTITHVQILVQHAEINDPYIDQQLLWPIAYAYHMHSST